MTLADAQAAIAAAITADPERIIRLTLSLAPFVASMIAAARAAGPVVGAAAIGLRYALRRADHAATADEVVKFANRLAGTEEG